MPISKNVGLMIALLLSSTAAVIVLTVAQYEWNLTVDLGVLGKLQMAGKPSGFILPAADDKEQM